MVVHLGYIKNDGKIQGGIVSKLRDGVKALFAKCGGVQQIVPNEVLDDYVENGGDNVVGFQQETLFGGTIQHKQKSNRSIVPRTVNDKGGGVHVDPKP